MKWAIAIPVILICGMARAQEIPATSQQQLEQLALVEEPDTDDDQLIQQLESYARHKIDINSEAAEVLVQPGLASVQQWQHLGMYRRLFGDLINISELQAVPGWDPPFIRRILPYIEVRTPAATRHTIAARWKGGEHSVILRFSRTLHTGDEYKPRADGTTQFAGDATRIFFRYRYVFRDKLQYGITGDKDAGEKFNISAGGFDFYSAHLFIRDVGRIKSIAIGDYTVNMGQGLIHWQSLAFKKSADAMNIKRQSPVLRPYNSAGEFNFFRGAGLTIAITRVQFTAFASTRKISTNHNTGPDGEVFTSVLRSGYNRTVSELADRGNTSQYTAGGVMVYRAGKLRIAANVIHYRYSLPQVKNDDPYNLFAIKGSQWTNASTDVMYTWKNIHVFGEYAVDQRRHTAIVTGLVASLGRWADFSLLFRNLNKAYQSVSGNAFTENTYPGNETGLYAGLSFRPATAWKADLYFDYYQFPWLRYRTHAPSIGRDWMLQLAYTPNRSVEITSRVRSNSGERNSTSDIVTIDYPVKRTSLNWRTQVNFKPSKIMTLRNRTEIVISNPGSSKGFLASADFIYKPMQKAYDLSFRMQYFETDNYDSRLYAYENDVLYAQSVPVFSGSGLRYYFILRYDITRRLCCWLRYAVTHTMIKSDQPDDAVVPIKDELKIQARLLF